MLSCLGDGRLPIGFLSRALFAPSLVRGFLGVCYPLVYDKVPETTVPGHVMNTGEYLWYVHALVDLRPNPSVRVVRQSISRSFPVEEREKAGLKDVSLSNQRRFKDVHGCP